MWKVLRTGIWWPTLHNDVVGYARSYDVYQCIGKPSRRDEMSLVPQVLAGVLVSELCSIAAAVQPHVVLCKAKLV